MLALLARRGVDLGAPCDGEGNDTHGTPARGLSARQGGRTLRTVRPRRRTYEGFRARRFYAVYHGKVRVLEALVRLGVDPDAPCTRFGELPRSFFKLHGPGAVPACAMGGGIPTAPMRQAWQRSSRAPVACATVQRQHVRVASGWHLGAGTFANASRVSVHCKHTHAAAASVVARAEFKNRWGENANSSRQEHSGRRPPRGGCCCCNRRGCTRGCARGGSRP